MKKSNSIMILLILLAFGVAHSTGFQLQTDYMYPLSDNTLYVGGSGPNNYTKIQDAINNASAGDTVFVYSGTYEEQVIINTTVNLIGENRESTIIKGVVTFNNVNGGVLKNFTLTHSTTFGGSLVLISSHLLRIEDNHLHQTWNSGICLKQQSEDNIITNNKISETYGYGIESIETYNNTISDNTLSDNLYQCLYLERSNGFMITHNNITDNGEGLSLVQSSRNTIQFNLIHSNNEVGIYLVQYSHNNKILHNHITKHKTCGLVVGDANYLSNKNQIVFNNIFNNDCSQAVVGGFGNLFLRNYWGRPWLLPYPIKNDIAEFDLLTFDWLPKAISYQIPQTGCDFNG